MDVAASEYRERLDFVLREIDNVNQRLERLYNALETGSLPFLPIRPRLELAGLWSGALTACWLKTPLTNALPFFRPYRIGYNATVVRSGRGLRLRLNSCFPPFKEGKRSGRNWRYSIVKVLRRICLIPSSNKRKESDISKWTYIYIVFRRGRFHGAKVSYQSADGFRTSQGT